MSKKVKILINLVTGLALLLVFWFAWEDIDKVYSRLISASHWLLILQIIFQFISFVMVAHFYHSFLYKTKALKQALSLKEMYKFALELNMVNHVYPGGGVSGFSYVNLRFQSLGVKVADSSLAHTMRFILTFLSYLPILAIGMLLLAFDQKVGGLVILISATLFTAIIGITAGFIFLINNKTRIKNFIAWLPKLINWLVQVLHYKSKKELISIQKVERVLEEIHHGYKQITQNWQALRKPFMFTILATLFDLLALYFICLMLGEVVNPGVIILAYAVANLAGIVAILPGGIGIYETIMIVVLHEVGGVPRDLAIPVTLIYRILKLVIFIPVGYFFYYTTVSGHQFLARPATNKKPNTKNNRKRPKTSGR